MMYLRAASTRLVVLIPLVFSLLACLREGAAPREGPESITPTSHTEAATANSEKVCDVQLELLSSVEENGTGTFIARTIPGNNERVHLRTLRGCVCVRIAVPQEPYDDLDKDAVVARTQLRLDGNMLDVAAAAEPDTIMEIRRHSAWPAGATARVPSPFAICWRSDTLSAGSHQAEVTYSKTSGKVEQYSWRFELWEQ